MLWRYKNMFEDVKNYFAAFGTRTDTCRTIALWVTVALLVAFVVTKLYVMLVGKRGKKYDKETLVAANKLVNGGWIIAAVITAFAFIVTFAACYFADVADGEDVLVPILFYPLLVAALAAVVCAVAIFVKPVKLCKIICAIVAGSALIAVIVCMAVYYGKGDAADTNGGDVLSNLGLYLSAVAVTAGVIVMAFISDRHSKPMDTRTVTFAAVCVALSFALSYVRLFKMPMGGSITFASMLPLMLFAFMFGPRKGVLVGLIYGILQAVQEPWIIHPAQFMLDYAVAFAAIGLTGCIRTFGALKGKMRGQFAVGACVACAFRFLSHYFAGVFAFGVYGASYAAAYNMPALANEYFYSFVYQCMYLIPELGIVLAAGMLVMASKNFRKQISMYCAYGDKPVRVPQRSDDAVSENSVDIDAQKVD